MNILTATGDSEANNSGKKNYFGNNGSDFCPVCFVLQSKLYDSSKRNYFRDSDFGNAGNFFGAKHFKSI